MYIGPTTQSIAGWNISTDGFTDSAGSVQFSSTQASMSLGTGQEVVIRGNSNSPFISVQPAVALVDKSYGETGIFFGVAGGATPLFSAVGAGGHLKFNGSSIDINSDTAVISGSAVSLLTPKFYFGEDSNFISGSNGNISIVNTGTTTLSGSQVTIQTPKFFLGGDSQFVSGSNGNIEISSSNFHLQSDGDVVMSGTITAAAGEIGGFTIGNDLSNSGGSTLKLKGSTGQITASAAQIAGNITATSGQIAGFTVSGNTLTATNFTLDASGKSISLGTGNTIFIADADEGIQLGHASFNSAPFSVTKAGVLKATSGTVGGWTLGSNTIVGANLTLNSSGLIETNDFASGVKGFRLDSTNNGQAEFENISIRGTLKTTVFEKETVNAVGGQLYVANSTTLTGSLAISASAATMSVVNVTGFTGSYANDGEILVAKKVTDTGFSTEYILVQSASRDNPSSDKDFSGKLYVVRGYQSGSTGDFLGDNANQSHSLAPGQVLASTGRIGTGYIRLNANPNDTTTPYIDIVERTGSGVYDVDLKARLGDLSGLSTARLHGTNPASAGFGLYSQNVFLEGGIVANTGSIGGIEMEAGKLYNGAGVHGNSNTGFYVDSGSKFSLGDKLVWDGSDLSVEGSITLTGGTGVATPTDVSASLNASSSALQGNIDNVESNVSGAFTATSSSIATDLNTVESNISGAFTEVSASIVQNIVTDISGSILDIPPAPGGEGLFLNFPHMGYFSGSEFTAFISASGGFLFKADDNNLISFGQTVTGGDGVNSKSFVLKSDNVFLSGSKVNILGERFFLGGDSQFVSGSNGNIEISSSKFHVKPDGDIVVGKVNATEGSIGGFDIGISQISSSTGGLILNNDGGITGSKFLLEGGIITSDVTIQGSLSANSISTPTGSSPLAEITDAGFAKFISASIGGFEVSQTQINSTNDKLILKSNGQISASSAQISGEINITGGASKTHLDALGSQTASLNASISSIGETTASLNSATASIIANVSGAFDEVSSSLVSNINTVEANVSGAFTEVSESITSRIMTDVSGSILDIPASPSGEGLYLNYPYMGFYGPPEPSSTTYTVTAAGGVYYIDGVQQATLELQVGYTYRFDTSAVGSHPFRFSTDSDNDNAYTTGVTVGSGYVDITITSSTPSTLYYYCTNHANMGGQINVVDNSEFTAFISASGGFLFKADDDNLISFGQSVSGSDGTPTKSFVLKSDNVFLSGSNVSILGERFFLGGDSQFVSGSNGNIEISSSKFHLDSSGNVTMDGTVTATTGEIGGFTISSNSISSSNDILRLKSSGQITASAIQLTGEVNITGGSAKSHLEAIGESTASLNTSVVEIGQSTSSLDASVVSIGQQTASLDESVVSIGQQTASLDASVVAIGESTASLTTASQSMAARVSLTSTGVDIFDSGSNRIARYTDTATIGKTSYPDNNVFIDDDSVEIRRGSQVSASFGTTTTIGPTSNKHVKITSNALEIKTDANTTVLSASAAGLEMQGTINSTAGEIGGFGISATTISSSNSNLILNSNGQITASAVSMSGTVNATSGLIGGMRIESNSIESAADAGDGSTTTYTVTVNGSSKYEIDGVQQASLIFLPGNTYRFDQADDSNENHPLRFVQTSGGTDYYTTGVTINGTPGSAGAYTEIAVTQSTPTQLYYRCSAHSGMGGSITVDKTSPLILDGNTGQISGSRFLFSGGKISGSSVEIDVENITMSGSSVDIKTPKFFLGGSSQFVSGSNTNIEISSSNFHLQPDGNVIMSGTVTATTGELGGFAITPTAISESNNRLILRSDGRITASFMQMTGEVNIAGGSAQTHLELIGEQTASLNTSVVSIGAQTASLDTSVVSIGAQTASLNTSVVSIGAQTASLDNSVVSIGATTASLQTVTASLQTASSSMASTAALTSTGMDIFDSGSNRVARFSDSVTLGKTGDHSRTVISNQSIDMYGYSIDEGNVYKRFTIDSSGDDPIVAIGGSDDADVSTTSTNDVIRIHPDNGIFIYKNNSDFVKISGTGVDIHAGSSSVTAASFGTTTTIGATAGEHIKITSAALEVKTDANTTVLSASAAGLEMEGAVKATSGEIGGFLISQNEISSSLTPKRGLVLKPGDAISGFGNSAHSTETVQGMFSFGVASVAPPAGTDGSPLGKGFKGGVGAYAQQDEEITP
jgi:plastocyanin